MGKDKSEMSSSKIYCLDNAARNIMLQSAAKERSAEYMLSRITTHAILRGNLIAFLQQIKGNLCESLAICNLEHVAAEDQRHQ